MSSEKSRPRKIRALIVDDEPLARERIRQLLADEPDVTVVAESPGGLNALEAISSREIDVVFLDVQMPEMDGFEILDALPAEAIPAVVFVTAYDTFAVRAFQVHALDYLLKPIDRDRFAEALERVRAHLAHRGRHGGDEGILELIKDLRAQRHYRDRLVINRSGRFRFVEIGDVDYITTEGNYVKIHAKNESHLLRSSMNALAKRLDPGQFVRIHRTTIVNIERLKELQPYRRDDAIALLKDGTRLIVSRRYRSSLLKTVERPA